MMRVISVQFQFVDVSWVVYFLTDKHIKELFYYRVGHALPLKPFEQKTEIVSKQPQVVQIQVI